MKKKLILTSIIILSVLVVGAITLVLTDPFSGAKFKGDIATEEQREEYIKLVENNFNDNFSYKFKFKETNIRKDKEQYKKEIRQQNGNVTVDFIESKFYDKAVSYSIKEKYSLIEKSGTLFNNNIKKEVRTQSVSYISRYHENNDKDQCFVDTKYKFVENKNKITKTSKSQSTNDIQILEPEKRYNTIKDDNTIKDRIQLNFGDNLYVTNKKYTIVHNSSYSLRVIEVYYKGDEITKVIYNYESPEYTLNIIYKITKYKTINGPRNINKYKPVEQ